MPLTALLPRSHKATRNFFLQLLAAFIYWSAALCAQTQQLPYLNAGPNSVFAQVDFSRMILDGQTWDETAHNRQDTLIGSGVVSALDLTAPDKAVKQYKQGMSAMKVQDTNGAVKWFQKAVLLYPDFVSAHNALGLAYVDQHDARAQGEFEIAAKLDDKFPGPFLNLGLLALAANDFASADANLEKAAKLVPDDPRVLVALAFAQNGNHRYEQSMQTVQRVHGLEHHGFANVHYIAAAAAMSLHDFDAAQAQLQSFLSEDPANPLSPVAQQRLQDLANGSVTRSTENSPPNIEELPADRLQMTFPNSEYLEAQLKVISGERSTEECETCSGSGQTPPSFSEQKMHQATRGALTFTSWEDLFTIHQAVDETALFFSVTHRGHAVNDLSLSDIQVRDDNKTPEKILQFVPQSKLPLRLGLLIDTSESVKHRVNFERKAAKKFLDKVLTNDTDLAFVEGFQSEVSVTQDFTRDEGKLAQGIDMLQTGGDGTALFDAVFLACWKLSAYPDEGRSAKVLVVLTDGEDNSSHRSLKQALEEADAAGVTVYTISTSDKPDEDTDANQILKTMGQRTGGQSIFPRNLPALDYYLNELPRAIRSRYLIAYKAADFKPDGKFRTIRVTAAKNGDQLRVQARKGYFARLGLTRY